LGYGVVYFYMPHLLQFDMHPGRKRIIELREEMADIYNMAAHLERKPAAVPDELYSSDLSTLNLRTRVMWTSNPPRPTSTWMRISKPIGFFLYLV